jgi:hypothetical protein
MDSLKDLPVDDKSQLSSDQKTVMEKYVGAPASVDNVEEQSSKWKLIAYISALFIALVNPLTQGIFNRFPYFGNNEVSVLVLTTIIFVIITTLVMFYA